MEWRAAVKHNLHVCIALFTVEALADAFICGFTLKVLAGVYRLIASSDFKFATLELLLLDRSVSLTSSKSSNG